MRYRVTIAGLSPILMHSAAAGMDAESAANKEKKAITAKRGNNRTEADDQRLRFLETLTALWLSDAELPTIPEHAIRATIEKAARKLKQGPQVREGLIVEKTTDFTWDTEKGGSTLEEICQKAQHTTPVVVQRSRILRTRAVFHDWTCTFLVDSDDELVDKDMLETWLDIAGRRCGIGDWRPATSGHFGRFETTSIQVVE